jgi:hypothetical protein
MNRLNVVSSCMEIVLCGWLVGWLVVYGKGTELFSPQTSHQHFNVVFLKTVLPGNCTPSSRCLPITTKDFPLKLNVHYHYHTTPPEQL